MRYAYRSCPINNRAFPKQTFVYRPILPVKIIYKHATSKLIACIVDTGSDYCLFHSSVCQALGIDLKSGREGDLGGVTGGPKSLVYYHPIKLVVGLEVIGEIEAGFAENLSENLLGQTGFFDNFIVTFDHNPNPPCFEINRIFRH